MHPVSPGFLPRPAPRHAGTGPARPRAPQRYPSPLARFQIGSRPRPLALRVRASTLAHLRSAFSSGLRCVRRCLLRAWDGPPLASSGLAPCWPGTMSGRARPAGDPAAAAAAGLLDRSSTLGPPTAGLCAAATTTMARDCLRDCAPPRPCRPPPPPPAFLQSWPSAIGQRRVTHSRSRFPLARRARQGRGQVVQRGDCCPRQGGPRHFLRRRPGGDPQRGAGAGAGPRGGGGRPGPGKEGSGAGFGVSSTPGFPPRLTHFHPERQSLIPNRAVSRPTNFHRE